MVSASNGCVNYPDYLPENSIICRVTEPLTKVFSDRSVLNAAYRLLTDSDKVVVKQMCLVIARLLASGAESVPYVLMDHSSNAWKQFLTILKAHGSGSTDLDVDIKRTCLWIFSQLSLDRDNRGELGEELFPVLVNCLRDDDRLVNDLAADVLFLLADCTENQGELIDTSLEFLVEQASGMALDERTNESGYGISSISKGCAKVLLLLAVKSGPDQFAWLLKETSSIFLLAVKYVFSRLHHASQIFTEEPLNRSAKLPLRKMAKEFMFFIGKYLTTLCSYFQKDSAEITSVIRGDTDLWTNVVTSVSSILCWEWVSVSSSCVYECIQSDDIWKDSLDRHGIVLAFLQLAKIPELKLSITKCLLSIAKYCWSEEGTFIYESLISMVDDSWVKSVSSLDVESMIIIPAVQTFNTVQGTWCPFEHSTYLVLDWLSRWCYTADGPIRANQEKVFSYFSVESGNVIPQQFSYLQDRHGFLEISVDGKIWRSLVHFFKFEFVENLKEFLRSSMKLWSYICAGSFDAAILKFRALLSFEQLLAGMEWALKSSNNHLLCYESYLFVDLMTVLYVNTDPSFPRYLGFSGRMVVCSEDGTITLSKFKHHSYGATAKETADRHRLALTEYLQPEEAVSCPLPEQAENATAERRRLQLLSFLDNFFGITWPVGQGIVRVENLKDLGVHIPFTLSVMDLTNNLVRYGLFSENARFLVALKAGLVRLALGHVSFVKEKTTSRYLAGMTAVKIEALRILEVVEEADQYILIDGVSKLLISSNLKKRGRLQSPVGLASDLKDLACSCTVSDFSVVRLNEVLSGELTNTLHQPHNKSVLDNRFSTLDNEFNALCEKADPTIVDLAMRVLMKQRSSLKQLYSHLDNFCLYSEEDFPLLNNLLELADKWSKVDLMRSNAVSKQHFATQLSALNFILQGVSVGAEVKVGNQVVLVSEWKLSETSRKCGIVTSLQSDQLIVDFDGEEEKCFLGIHEDTSLTAVVLKNPSARKREFQNLARFVGTLDIVVDKVNELGHLESLDGCDTVVANMFEAVLYLVRKNDDAKLTVIKNSSTVNIISHCLTMVESVDCALLVLEELFTVACDAFYKLVSLKTIHDIMKSIDLSTTFKKQHLVVRLMKLLLAVLPTIAELDPVGSTKFQALEMQKTTLNGLYGTSFLINLSDVIESNDHEALALEENIYLTELLSRSTMYSHSNWKELRAKFKCFSLAALKGFFEKLRASAFGYESRVHILRPWLLLLFSLGTIPVQVTPTHPDANLLVKFDEDDEASTLESLMKLFVRDGYDMFDWPVECFNLARNSFIQTENISCISEKLSLWTFITVPNVQVTDKSIKVQFDTDGMSDFYNIKLLKNPPKTADDCYKFRTKIPVKVFSEYDEESSVRGAVGPDCCLTVKETAKIYIGNSKPSAQYVPPHHLWGKLVNVTGTDGRLMEGLENGWVPLNPSTCRICDCDGVIWDTPNNVIFECAGYTTLPDRLAPLIIGGVSFIVEYSCGPDTAGSGYSEEARPWRLSASGLSHADLRITRPTNSPFAICDSLKAVEWRVSRPTGRVETKIISPDTTKLGMLLTFGSDSYLHGANLKIFDDIEGTVLVQKDLGIHWPGSQPESLPVFIPASSCNIVIDFETDSDFNRGFSAKLIASDLDALEFTAKHYGYSLLHLKPGKSVFSGSLARTVQYVTGYASAGAHDNIGLGGNVTCDDILAKLKDIGSDYVVVESHELSSVSAWEEVRLENATRVAVLFDARTTSHMVQFTTPALTGDTRYRMGNPLLRFNDVPTDGFGSFPCSANAPVIIGSNHFAVHIVAAKSEDVPEFQTDNWGYRMVCFDADVLNGMWAAEVRVDSAECVTILDRSADGAFYQVESGLKLIGDGLHHVSTTLPLVEENYTRIQDKLVDLFNICTPSSVHEGILAILSDDGESPAAEESKDGDSDRQDEHDVDYDVYYPKSTRRSSTFVASRIEEEDVSSFYSSPHGKEDDEGVEFGRPHYEYLPPDVDDVYYASARSREPLWVHSSEFDVIETRSSSSLVLPCDSGKVFQFLVDCENFKLSYDESVVCTGGGSVLVEICSSLAPVYCCFDGDVTVDYCVHDDNKRIAWKILRVDVSDEVTIVEGVGFDLNATFDEDKDALICFGPEAQNFGYTSMTTDDDFYEKSNYAPVPFRCKRKFNVHFSNYGYHRCYVTEQSPVWITPESTSLFSHFHNKTEMTQTMMFDAPIPHGYCEFTVQSDNSEDCFVQIGCVADRRVILGEQCRSIGNRKYQFCVDGINGDGQAPRCWYNKKLEVSVNRGMCFRPGSVIGFKIVGQGKPHEKVCVEITLNGLSLGFAPLEFPVGLEWRPAFSFSPGQRLSINIGQAPFLTPQLEPVDVSSIGGTCYRVWDNILSLWRSCDLTTDSTLFDDPASPLVSFYAQEIDRIQDRSVVCAAGSHIKRNLTAINLRRHGLATEAADENKSGKAVDVIKSISSKMGYAPDTLPAGAQSLFSGSSLSELVQVGYDELLLLIESEVKRRMLMSGVSYASAKVEGNPALLLKTPNTSLDLHEVPIAAQIEDLAVAEILSYRRGSLCDRMDKILSTVGTKGTPWLSRELLMKELSISPMGLKENSTEELLSHSESDRVTAETVIMEQGHVQHETGSVSGVPVQFQKFMKPGKFGIVQSGGYTPGCTTEALFSLPGVSKIAVLFDAENTHMQPADYVSFVSEQAYAETQFSTPDVAKFNPLDSGTFPAPGGTKPFVISCGGNLRILWRTGKAKLIGDRESCFKCFLFDARLTNDAVLTAVEFSDSVQMFNKLVKFGITTLKEGMELSRVVQIVKFFRYWAYSVPKEMFAASKITRPKVTAFFRHKKKELTRTLAQREKVRLLRLEQGDKYVGDDDVLDEAELLDVFVGPDQAVTLSNIQHTFVYLGVVEFCCELLVQYKDHDAFMQGIHLGNFIMMNLNLKSQQEFAKCIKSCGCAALGAVSKKLATFNRDISSSVGITRECKLRDSIDVMRFLQTLCDGQFRELQMCMTKAFANDGKRVSLVQNVVAILQEAYNMILISDLKNKDDMKLYLDVAQQCMDTLIDFVQGPVAQNQDACLETDLLEYLMKWIEQADSIRMDLLKDLEEGTALPELKFSWKTRISKALEVKNASRHGFFKSSSVQELWPLMRDIDEVERSALSLIANVLDNVRVHTDTLEVDDAYNARFSKVISCLATNADMLVHRFKIIWASVVFDGNKSVDKFFSQKLKKEKKLRQAQNEASDGIAKGDSFKKKMSRIVTIINDDTNLSFKPSSLKLEEAEVMMYMKVWLLYNDEDYDGAISSAFSYYQLMNFVSSQYADAEFVKDLPTDAVSSLQHVNEKWTGRGEDSMISKDEAFAFDNYFVSIEVVINDQLVRIYFPIPRYCREQLRNPLVQEEMENAKQEVDRDSAETKLSNFLDLALQVENVITQQDKVNRSSVLLRFITSKNEWWVFIMGSLTLTLNTLLLLFVSNSSADDDESDLVPTEVLHIIHKIGYAHFAMSLVMLVTFMLGRTLVNVNNGFKWKRLVVEDVVALPVDNRALLAVFKIADDLVPNAVWATFFMALDVQTLYYFAAVVFSALGCWVNIAFFCFHVLDITLRIQLLGYVLKSVFMNGSQVVVTFVLGAVLTWIYAVIGVYCFGFNQYSYGDSPGYTWPETLRAAYWQHLDFGLRGPPIFNDYAKEDQAGKYVFDISYQVSE
jgi:hypothetical protein